MAHHRPRVELDTHRVENQAPPRGDVDPWAEDRMLRAAVLDEHGDRVAALGRRCGSEEVREWGEQANRNPPRWLGFDRYGRRIDEVEFHPAYHQLMDLGLGAGVAAAAWKEPGGHALHSALLYTMAQAEPSVCCPMSMSYAAVPALQQSPEWGPPWVEGVMASTYDPSSQPPFLKQGLTLGMAMTEKQGGSDVRSGTTRAVADGEAYRLTGHKWFCSAPMSDGFLTLAHSEAGLSCFLVPRWTPDGERNPFALVRLKDKLGDRANASSEVEYKDTWAVLLGEPGRGVKTILSMVHHTRLDCLVAPAAFMRRTVDEAVHHARHRRAFGKKLLDHPLMERVLADLAVECEASAALAFRLAQAFDLAAQGDATAPAFCRIATPVAKYWHNKRVVPVVHEAMEVHGGAGYIEESPLPLYYRQAPLNGIWEGSGNIMCLDVLRALERDPDCMEAVWDDLTARRGQHRLFDAFVFQELEPFRKAPPEPATARHFVEKLGLALQAGSLLRQPEWEESADAFCRLRLSGSSFSLGAHTHPVAARDLVRRAFPD